MKRRYIVDQVAKDLTQKIVIITGPRQAGKTTMAKHMYARAVYLNYDQLDHRHVIHNQSWDRQSDLVIFDEIHKMSEWKRFLKGVYDVDGITPKLIVTGSAKLDVFRKVGDSLAGRYFRHRLYPFDVHELMQLDPDSDSVSIMETLVQISGFPEPYLAQSERAYKRWRTTHLDIILRQDLVDLANVRHVSDIQTLVMLLRERVGSPISYSSLARDLQCSPQTVKNWLLLLENLFVVFKVIPYSKKISRAITKEPKYYFYDTAFVQGNMGIKLENATAVSLLKYLHHYEDITGESGQLHYVRTRNGHEVDFYLTAEAFSYLLEVKQSDANISKSLAYFATQLPEARTVQLVHQLDREATYPGGIEVRQLAPWLANLDPIH